MHGFVETQAFDIGPVEELQHSLCPDISFGRTSVSKATYFALPSGSTRLEDIRERDANPGHHHRPAFDAAHPEDTLFERMRIDEIVKLILRRLGDQPSMLTRQGRDRQAVALAAGSDLLGPNS